MPRCLIVDDHPNNRMVARFIFEDLDCEIVEADSARAAIEALESTRIDMMLLDWMMPQMDGIAFLKMLRSNPRDAAIKVIMCSAKDGEAVVQAALDAGADGYLAKPITFDTAEKMLKGLGLR